jgi:hypothetical protein
MTHLFYALLTTPKTKRWLRMLDQLEEQALTGNELAVLLDCTRRTVVSDVKQMKESFQSTLSLLGDEFGYLVKLEHPQKYYQEKQVLLENEVLFFLVDTLFENQKRSNKELAEQLCLSMATFTRLKHYLNQVLQGSYGLKLSSTTNQVIGPETRIREFFFDFYFTLPLYPKVLTEKIRRMRGAKMPKLTTRWQLKQAQLRGWLMITNTRIKQGEHLLENGYDQQMCHKLAQAFDPAEKLALPALEKAALFLATLDEAQFLRPVIQTEFIYQFSTASWRMLLTIEEAGNHVLLFQTLIQLMGEFFHLPYEQEHEKQKTQEVSQSTEDKLLNQLIALFLQEKAQVEKSIFVIFRLVGSQALQRWIKEEVRCQLRQRGYHLYEEANAIHNSSLPRVHVTNSPNALRQADISLTTVPTRKEIDEQVQQYQKD